MSQPPAPAASAADYLRFIMPSLAGISMMLVPIRYGDTINIGMGIVAACVGVVFWAFVHRDKQPRKTLFEDVMPVGNEIAFTTGTVEKESQEGESTED